MDLREEMNKLKVKELNVEVKRENELEKHFIQWVNTGEIEPGNKEKILDELQLCLDNRSLEGASCLKEALLEADYCYKNNNYYKNRYAKEKNKFTITPTNFPTELKLLFRELKLIKNLDEINKVADELGINKIERSYSMMDLEKFVIEIFMWQTDKISKIIQKLNDIKLPLGELIGLLNPRSIYIEGTSNFNLKKHTLLAIYLMHYLKNIDPLINGLAIEELAEKFHFLPVTNPPYYSLSDFCKEYHFGWYNDGDYRDESEEKIWVYLKENEEKAKDKHDSLLIDKSKWLQTAKTFLEPVVNVVINKLQGKTASELQSNPSVNMNTFIEANAIKKHEEVRRCFEAEKTEMNMLIKEYGLSGIWLIPALARTDVVIIRNNLYCIIPFSIKENKIAVGQKIKYGIFSPKDIITIKNREHTFPLEITIKPMSTNKASVVGRTIVGEIVGGTVGGIIGATSAIEENRIKEDIRRHYEPLFKDVTSPEIHIYAQEYFGMQQLWIEMRIGQSKQSTEYYMEFIEKFREAHSNENFEKGKLIKQYLESKGFSFDIETYYKDMLNLPQYQEMLKEEIQSLNTKENQLKDLEKQLNQLGIFKIKEKKMIKEKMDVLSNEIQNLNIFIRQSV